MRRGMGGDEVLLVVVVERRSGFTRSRSPQQFGFEFIPGHHSGFQEERERERERERGAKERAGLETEGELGRRT